MTRHCVLIAIVTAVIGVGAGYFAHYFQNQRIPVAWFELQNVPTTGEDGGVGFTSEAAFNSDIPLPDVKKISAKMKFTEAPTQKQSNLVSLGYIVSVDVESLNELKVPEKYKKMKTEKYKAGTFTFEPAKEVVYDIKIEFSLLDKDGFKLLDLKSQQHSLTSGKENIFQDLVPELVPQSIARRTAKIKPRLLIEKCATCE